MSLVDFLPGHVEKKKGLMIVDFSLLALSTVFATFKPTEIMQHQHVKTCILNSVRTLTKKFKATYPEIVLAFDARDYWRRDIAEYYKGHRAKNRDKSPYDFKIIYGAMNELEVDLRNSFPYKVLNVDRCEADDIAGVLCKHFHDKYESILLCSADGDWLQLQQFKNVKQFSSMHGKMIQPKHGGPKGHLLYKIIKGDKKDGISNIKSERDAVITGTRQKGISEVNFEKWAKMDRESFCDSDMLARFNENESLLDLTKVPEQYENDIIKAFTETVPATRGKIYPYLIKGGFSLMVENVNDF
jgi:hypothetical protein